MTKNNSKLTKDNIILIDKYAKILCDDGVHEQLICLMSDISIIIDKKKGRFSLEIKKKEAIEKLGLTGFYCYKFIMLICKEYVAINYRKNSTSSLEKITIIECSETVYKYLNEIRITINERIKKYLTENNIKSLTNN